ncbi:MULTISPECIES: DUF6238 family protein [unclassified Streptomyces]|uniref:DUF6238 family protein n=1 Tax=unclassified Streptomyces TaxID=2593676 RepID=UPI000DC7EA7D|nr:MULTISPECIES: DUF6238 family protein [unclassified Streptomyces]AWZ08023.1 hypothetical protein DRB89_29315 [Streptomyces sp. ICC4]AWZ14466.1 hypothetical protein DRB96_21815 [Streptomyces sp. ICC1]
MTNPTIPPGDAHPYLRAATAGIRHHTRQAAWSTTTADRVHLDVLHSHLTGLHLLMDRLADTTRPQHPAAGRHLDSAHLRLWQAATSLHDAFHTLPAAERTGADPVCRPDALPEGPPVLTICQRQLASGHAIRRKTTPADHGPRPARTA